MDFTDEQKRAMSEYQKKFIDELNSEPIEYVLGLEKAKSSGYICPICRNGEGKDGTGVKIKDNRIACYKGACFKSKTARGQESNYQDVLGALRCIYPSKSINDILKEHFGTRYSIADALKDNGGKPAASMGYASSTPPQNKTAMPPSLPPAVLDKPEPPDLTEYYKECRRRLTDHRAISYLQARGISLETAARYWIGFDPQSDPAQSHHPEPRIICPSSNTHYMARAINPDLPQKYQKMNNLGAHPDIFNHKVLYDSTIEKVFVTEGVFNALSIIEAGAAAIALNGASNASNLINQFEKKRPAAIMILCPDNDPAGLNALETLKAGLKRLNISYVTADINNGLNDANDALIADRAAFIAAVQRIDPAKPDNVAAYMDDLMSKDIDAFKESKDRKTGFAMLDAKAKGLYTGLYVVGAISSLGKTTFCTQLADQLAAAGEDVLFFSLEQSRLELVSKSIARRTAQRDMTTAIDSLSIRRGYLPQQVIEAISGYRKDVGDRLSIIEGNFTCNAAFIGDYVRRYIRKTGTKPVIFVDYLQILQPEKDDRGHSQSTKETVDSTITELKRLSREHGLTIFVISSLNRSNYLTPVDFESFKETGSIEYTADVVWGLQLQVMNDDIFDCTAKIKQKRAKVKEAKKADPRKIELVCLKNRYGVSSYSCYFDYFPRYDLYIETLEPPELKEKEDAPAKSPKRTPAKPTRQQELNTLISAFKEIESPIEPNTASLESLADKLDLKKATLRRKFKEFTRLFSIKGDKVTYYPEGELEDELTEFEPLNDDDILRL